MYTQRWGRAYRDQTFHECINTNNGTESLNKALKYTYLPRARKATNLSGIVTTLVDTFLPALRQKYLFSNFEQSSANRQYKNGSPIYLHNRPKAIILHCLDRKARSSEFESDNVTNLSEGVFKVNSADKSYTLNFSTPSCTCPDWIETNYPCKHFFAVFRHYPTWDWNTLPSTYLESPRLSLDTKALDNYFKSSPSTTNSDSASDGNLKEERVTTEEYSAIIQKKKVKYLRQNW